MDAYGHSSAQIFEHYLTTGSHMTAKELKVVREQEQEQKG